MLQRRILAALALLCAIAPAYAQKTKAVLNAEIAAQFPDDVVGAITPQVLRNVTGDMVNSVMPTAPVVSGNIASFNGTTGLLQDSGIYPAAVVSLGSFCTVDRTGASDMGACINAALSASKNCAVSSGVGNTTILIPEGKYLITTPIVPKSCISMVGDGRGKTEFITTSNTPFAQASGSQVVHFNMSGITFTDSGTHSGATVLSFTTIQGSRLVNLGFHGYTTGTMMSINPNGTVVSAFDDNTGVWNSSNSFFNTFEDFVVDDQVSYGMVLAGFFSSPCNVNTPVNLVTLNVFKDIQLWGVTSVGWDLVRGNDSNTFIGTNIIRLTGNGGGVITPHASFKNIAVQLGDDNATCTTNNDVALERMMLTVSMASPATSFVMFNSGNNNFGHLIDFQTDQSPSVNSGFTSMTGVTSVDYSIHGRNYITTLDDGVGNLHQLDLSVAKYYRWDDGTAALPMCGFSSELTNGCYRPSAGVFGFTKAISSGSNGGTVGSLLLNGNTSGGATVTVPAAAGSPVLTLGSGTGTPAVTASAPLAISTSTGNITCATCNTGSNRQILPLSSATVTLAQSTAGFMLHLISGSETNVESICPLGGTFKNLYVQSTAPASGQTFTNTWRVNGSGTSLTCTITGPGTTCNDTTHTATCTAGQTYSMGVTTSATSGTMNFIAGGVEFDNP